MELLLAEM